MTGVPNISSQSQQSDWRDFIELTKPRITLFCILMTLGGLAMAPRSVDIVTVLATLIGTALSVGAANTLNMYWERSTDKLMSRTAQRPLAAERLNPNLALGFGILQVVLSMFILSLAVNPLTAALSLFAFGSYVFVYTPLKRVTPHALLVGAVPGAMPPLLGWTAATAEISAPGLVLFSILLIWQIPHFIAISFNHVNDYKNAGIKTWPGERGTKPATYQALLYSIALIPVSLLLLYLNVAGLIYGITGAWMLMANLKGLNPVKHPMWARQLFFASLVYLPLLTVGLAIDVLLQ
jgi:heme o synthase